LQPFETVTLNRKVWPEKLLSKKRKKVAGKARRERVKGCYEKVVVVTKRLLRKGCYEKVVVVTKRLLRTHRPHTDRVACSCCSATCHMHISKFFEMVRAAQASPDSVGFG